MENPVTTKFSNDQIQDAMERVPQWSELNSEIQRTYQFDDFKQAMAFVNRVAQLAEQRQHHPDILIRYNKITLTLSTHDAGGITDKDFQLASEIDQLAGG